MTSEESDPDHEYDYNSFSESFSVWSKEKQKHSQNCKCFEVPKRFRLHRACYQTGFIDFVQGQDTFHNLEDFDWGNNAYNILRKYSPQYADCLNDEMEYAFSMTNGCFGNDKVETGPFRNAVVMYLMGIQGIKEDSF